MNEILQGPELWTCSETNSTTARRMRAGRGVDTPETRHEEKRLEALVSDWLRITVAAPRRRWSESPAGGLGCELVQEGARRARGPTSRSLRRFEGDDDCLPPDRCAAAPCPERGGLAATGGAMRV